MLSDEEFNNIYSKVPRLCVDLIVKTEKGILFTKRAIEPCKGQWHLPGGTVFLHETWIQALRRIAKQELNLEVETHKFLGIIEYLREEKKGKHDVSLAVLTNVKSGEVKLNWQANDFIFSSLIPENAIPEQKEFLLKNSSNF